MFSKKRFLGFTLAALMIGSSLVGCTGKNQAGTDNQSTDTEKEIKIGLNYELSGGAATYGQSSVNGIEMAFEEINAAGGVLGSKLVSVKADNKSDAAEAMNVATKLITQDKVVAMLGPATSGCVKGATPVLLQNKVPLASASATADDVTVDKSGVKDYIFRICFSDSFQGTAMANYASRSMNATKAVMLIDNANDYSKGLAKNFKETFEKNGGTIVGEEAYVAKEKDFKAILTKIKGMDFDVIFLPGYYEEVGLIVKQARELGIDKPFLGGDGFDSPKLLEIAGAEALNNVFFSSHYSSQDDDPKVVKFNEAFKAKYNKEPNAFEALGYDLGYFLADAIKRAGSADPEKIKEAMEATTDFEGITGKLSVDENHNSVKSITVIELKDGVQTFNEKIEP